MTSYVARQPIVDRNKKTVAFELLYRDGKENCFPNVTADYATKSILINQILVHQKKILDGKKGFINFGYESLIGRLPFDFPSKKYVIEILESCEPSDDLFNIVVELKRAGYTIALDDYVPTEAWCRFYHYIDIIKFDITTYPLEQAAQYLKTLTKYDIQFLAERVETYEQFNTALDCGFHLFQGYFFSKPEMIKSKVLDSSLTSKLKLSVALSKEQLDLNLIESIIASNPGLSLKLLNFVNECSTIRSPIKSLQQALVYLGQDRVRKFITYAVLKTLTVDKPDIVITMTLQRARFFEIMLDVMKLKDQKELGYLCGLLSMIDALLDAEMSSIIAPLNINDSIKSALLGGSGVLGDLIKLTESIESSDWDKVTEFSQSLSVSEADIDDAFVVATLWADEVTA
jgi:EAL and modified HD-GYP domain-containing signal transduction protein